MKKALAIFMVLAMVTGVAFAADAPATFGNESVVAVSGDATLTWGMDLNEDGGNGFNNEANWAIKIPLLAKQTFTKSGEGNYAEIKIKDAQYNINGEDGDNAKFIGGDKQIDGIDAKLVFGAVYMTVHGKPGFKTNNAELWAPIKADSWGDNDGDVTYEPGFDGFGTKIGYKAEKFDVGVKVASRYTWERAGEVTTDDAFELDLETGVITFVPGETTPAETTDNEYAVGIDVSVTPSDMVTASFTANYATWDGSAGDPIMSIGAKVVAKPIADLVVTAGLDAGSGNDTNADGDAAMAYDAMLTAAYKYAGAGFYYSAENIAYTNFFGSVDSDGAKVSDAAIFFKVMDGGAVENLSASATFMMNALLSDHTDGAIPMAFGVNVSYKYAMGDVNYVKPFANVYGQNNFATAGAEEDMAMAYEIGADYGLFANAVITAKIAAGSTQDNKHKALLKTAASGNDDTDANDKGLFTLAVKVNY